MYHVNTSSSIDSISHRRDASSECVCIPCLCAAPTPAVQLQLPGAPRKLASVIESKLTQTNDGIINNNFLSRKADPSTGTATVQKPKVTPDTLMQRPVPAIASSKTQNTSIGLHTIAELAQKNIKPKRINRPRAKGQPARSQTADKSKHSRAKVTPVRGQTADKPKSKHAAAKGFPKLTRNRIAPMDSYTIKSPRRREANSSINHTAAAPDTNHKKRAKSVSSINHTAAAPDTSHRKRAKSVSKRSRRTKTKRRPRQKLKSKHSRVKHKPKQSSVEKGTPAQTKRRPSQTPTAPTAGAGETGPSSGGAGVSSASSMASPDQQFVVQHASNTATNVSSPNHSTAVIAAALSSSSAPAAERMRNNALLESKVIASYYVVDTNGETKVVYG